MHVLGPGARDPQAIPVLMEISEGLERSPLRLIQTAHDLTTSGNLGSGPRLRLEHLLPMGLRGPTALGLCPGIPKWHRQFQEGETKGRRLRVTGHFWAPSARHAAQLLVPSSAVTNVWPSPPLGPW